jgi:hypothetical protein
VCLSSVRGDDNFSGWLSFTEAALVPGDPGPSEWTAVAREAESRESGGRPGTLSSTTQCGIEHHLAFC